MSSYSISLSHSLGKGGALNKLVEAAHFYQKKYPQAKMHYTISGQEVNLHFWAKGKLGNVVAKAGSDFIDMVLQVPKGTLVPAALLKAFVSKMAQKWIDGSLP